MFKTNNLIIIGGMISAGKSTLVKRLSEKTGWKPIYERMEEDRLNELVLEYLYRGDRLHDATTQTFFTTLRAEIYKNVSNSEEPIILDRALWEDILFSTELMDTNGYQYISWKKFWKQTLDTLLEKYGKPKVYIYLKVDWENFRERIYNRNFESEISNFAKNEEYFKSLLKSYNEKFEDIIKSFGIDLIVVDSVGKDKAGVLETTIKELKMKGIL